ncbi:MAG: hypothetical protein KY467_05445 [Gemmatimonadetes bacterium]|nr:hypothetical protein [Gemmatimonadota bacterium]
MNGPENIAFHAASPSGGQGYVILLFRPDAEGNVRFREWSSADYMAPGREDVLTAEEMSARVAEWARTGWKLTESPVRIRHWLREGR